MSSDFEVTMIGELLTPGLIFVNDGGPCAPRIQQSRRIELIVALIRWATEDSTVFRSS
jgi:hypothetical protein